jgi:hypothetical protein
VGRAYHLHVPIVLKSGSLKLLEPYGNVQACNGIALPLPLHFTFKICYTFSERILITELDSHLLRKSLQVLMSPHLSTWKCDCQNIINDFRSVVP